MRLTWVHPQDAPNRSRIRRDNTGTLFRLEELKCNALQLLVQSLGKLHNK
jgi:hypothetical protein